MPLRSHSRYCRKALAVLPFSHGNDLAENSRRTGFPAGQHRGRAGRLSGQERPRSRMGEGPVPASHRPAADPGLRAWRELSGKRRTWNCKNSSGRLAAIQHPLPGRKDFDRSGNLGKGQAGFPSEDEEADAWVFGAGVLEGMVPHPSIRCGINRLRLPVTGEASPRAESPRHSSPTIHSPHTKWRPPAWNRLACCW